MKVKRGDAMPEDTKSSQDTAKQRPLAERVRTDRDFQKRISDIIKPYVEHMAENFNRASALIGASHGLTDKSQAQDVLRAAVVLNHAYLEDLLRTLAGQLLPEAGEAALNDIPLAGSESVAHPQKLQLGKLARHKGKMVDDVIRESIARHLDRVTYNDTNQISQQLETLGFKVAEHNQYFPAIQQMIQRRHQIVHRADKVKIGDSNAYKLQPIEPQQVSHWLGVTTNFMQSLMGPLFLKLTSLEDIAKQLNVKLKKA
jgi:hypothetical protein